MKLRNARPADPVVAAAAAVGAAVAVAAVAVAAADHAAGKR
jgi:hypothetical protein